MASVREGCGHTYGEEGEEKKEKKHVRRKRGKGRCPGTGKDLEHFEGAKGPEVVGIMTSGTPVTGTRWWFIADAIVGLFCL